MKATDQKSPIIRAASLHDAPALAILARRLLLFEKSLNDKMGVLAPWASNAAEIRKQIRRPNTRFFVAEKEGEIIGYIKVVVHGVRLPRSDLGLIRWSIDVFEDAMRDLINFSLRRPRQGVETQGGYIAGAFVVPEERRARIGTLLVEAAEEWLAAYGIAACELHVLFSNESARRFWEARGYEPLTLGMRKK